MSKITLIIDDELENNIKLLARHESLTLTGVINKALTEFAERNAKGLAFEKMQERELREFKSKHQKG